MEYLLCVLERGKAHISRQSKVKEAISNIRSNILFFCILGAIFQATAVITKDELLQVNKMH